MGTPGHREKAKVFRDSVHGYISVPESYCRYLIDTPLFQRLRHVEQTTMRCLYPSAHHDRFIHSLGVYHLGSLAFDRLRDGMLGSVKVAAKKWSSWRHTFLIACLMHDCGHGPFSHTFEKYYELAEKQKRGKDWPLAQTLAEKAGIDENQVACASGAAPHEIISAVLLLDRYREAMFKIAPDADPILAARMITGWQHLTASTPEEQVEDILISMLNGPIDVDKLDYVIRDTWASGADNATVDIHRLLGAICVGKNADGKLVLAFNKSALSVLDSVFSARNYLYRWIYSHHKVCYDTELLRQAVRSLGIRAESTSDEEKKSGQEDFLCSLFSLDLFHDLKTINGRDFCLPSDVDLLHHLKIEASKDIQSVAFEWLSRQHKKVALWKSFAEFCRCFATSHTYTKGQMKPIRDKFEALIRQWESDNRIELGLRVIQVDVKLLDLDFANIHIQMRDETLPYAALNAHTGSSRVSIPEFFYAYIDKAHEGQSTDLLNYIRRHANN